MNKIEQIIKAINEELITKDKNYLTLGIVNNLLVNKGIITIPERRKGLVKKLCSESKIPNAHQTHIKPRQWRFTLSKEYQFKRSVHTKKNHKIKNKTKPISTMQLVIGAVSILFIIGLLIPDDSYTLEVKNSPWDNSVHQVERYIKNNLSDPNSFEVIQWSKVRDMTHSQYGYRYKVMVKYRAKNSFGGYEIQSNIFFLDKKGNVVDVR
jgi:hypothetical protein